MVSANLSPGYHGVNRKQTKKNVWIDHISALGGELRTHILSRNDQKQRAQINSTVSRSSLMGGGTGTAERD
jgi:hypothetical protein